MESIAPDTLHIWKEMGEELRLKSAAAFYADNSLKEFQRAADMFIARNKNFRPAFVKRLPVEKRAFYLATLGVPADLIGQLLVSYHFTHQRAMMSEFLNALGIANENGVISEATEVSAPAKEVVVRAVEEVKGKFPAQDLYLYLATLHAQNPETWNGVEEVLPGLQAAK
ncbi:MAG: hypothetical protein JWO20_434 [Candidatus Angelobacter sp.]|nr:hypothetical protein [Candidatus Angelobacter sp.]